MMPLSADQATVNILIGVGYMDPTAPNDAAPRGIPELRARILV
jgi:hypothetical protein